MGGSPPELSERKHILNLSLFGNRVIFLSTAASLLYCSRRQPPSRTSIILMPISTERDDDDLLLPNRTANAFPSLEHFKVNNIPPAAY